MIPQFGQLNFTYPQVILGSAALTGALAELTRLGSTRSEISILFAITAVVLMTLKCPNSRNKTELPASHTPTRSVNVATAILGASVVLLMAGSSLGVFRSIRPGHFGGFGTIAAEDNAAWLGIITNWYHGDFLASTFGDTIIVFLVTFAAFVRALSFGHLGVTSLGDLVIHLNLMYAAIHLFAASLFFKLWRRFVRTKKPNLATMTVILTALFAQQYWISITRNYGHLSSILSCQMLAYFSLKIVFAERRSRLQVGLELIMCAGACFLWLPLKPVGLILLVCSSTSFLIAVFHLNRNNPSRRVLNIVLLSLATAGIYVVTSIGITKMRNLIHDAAELIQSGGGTPNSNLGHILLAACVSAFLLMTVDKRPVQGVVLIILSYTGATLAYSFWATGSSNYGSDKLVWWLLGFLFTFGGCALAILSAAEDTKRESRSKVPIPVVTVAAFLSFLVFSARDVTGVTLFEAPKAAWVFGDSNPPEKWWGSSDPVLTSSVLNGPIGCVEVSHDDELVPSWDGYLCSRMVGWTMAWNRTEIQPDDEFRKFALLEQNGDTTVARLAWSSTSNLARPVVLLRSGRYYGQKPLFDVLSSLYVHNDQLD